MKSCTGRIILIALAALALGACAWQPDGVARLQAGADRDKTSQPISIVYRRSGGFAGLREEWVITESGLVRSSKGTQRQVAPGEVLSLVEKAKAAGIFTSPPTLGPSRCRDCFRHELTIISAEGKAILVVDDMQEGVPQPIRELIAAVQALVASG